jgi:hypothetical protein
LVEDPRLAAVDLAVFFAPVAFLAELFPAVDAFAAVFFAAGLAAGLFFTIVLFFAAGLAFRAAVLPLVPVAAVPRFFALPVRFPTPPPVVLFLALPLFPVARVALVLLAAAFALAPVLFVFLFPAGEVLFFEAFVLLLAAPGVFLEVVDFFPAPLRELPPPLLLAEEVLAFGIVISLLIHCYSISVFLLIW